MTEDDRPTYYLVAGPNGAGKSSLTGFGRFQDAAIIDPDVIAKRINSKRPEDALLAAGRQAIAEIKGHVSARRSFVQETTLTGKAPFHTIERVREAGYRIELHFVGLDSLQKSHDRVKDRVRAGGHDIPAEAIDRRFDKSFANAVEAAAVADRSVFYDNSSRQIGVVFEKDGDDMRLTDGAPLWSRAVASQLRERAFVRLMAPNPTRGEYIWNTEAWPRITYDARALQPDFERVTAKVGELTGLRASLSPRDKALSYVNEVADEAVNSYAIELETLDKGELTKSVIASMLNRDSRDAAGQYRNVAEVMLDARDPSKPLSVERLHEWHLKMFGHDRFMKDVGRLRQDEMQVVTMRNGQVRRVHYEAPPPDRLEEEMSRFIGWLERTGPKGEEAGQHSTPARAALAHLKFETIHPYSDGNGRIGRAIADHVASESPTYSQAPFSLSRVIQSEKNAYYDALQEAQKLKPNEKGEIDATKFVRWFTNAMERGVERARDEARFIVARNTFFDRHGEGLNERQETVLKRLFDEGKERVEQGISAKPYMKISGASPASTTRDLKDLAENGILTPKPGGGRNTAYSLNVSFGRARSPRDDLRDSRLSDEQREAEAKKLAEKNVEKRTRPNNQGRGRGRGV